MRAANGHPARRGPWHPPVKFFLHECNFGRVLSNECQGSTAYESLVLPFAQACYSFVCIQQRRAPAPPRLPR